MSEPLPMTLDPLTLHASYDDPAAASARADELRTEIRTAPDEIGELVARGDLVMLLRGLGELDEALHEADAAVDRAEIAGTRPQQHTARTRLAAVHQWRGDFAQSNVLFTELLAVTSRFGPVIEVFTRQHAGENDYDQGHWADARSHFARALAVAEELELADEADTARQALAAAERRLDEDADADVDKDEDEDHQS